jgi:hypothetical protein
MMWCTEIYDLICTLSVHHITLAVLQREVVYRWVYVFIYLLIILIHLYVYKNRVVVYLLQ